MVKSSEWLIGALLCLLLLLAAWWQWLPYSLVETFGFVTGAACVWLVVRQHVWNFPVGLVNNLFSLVLFSRSRLYADAGLQIVYLVLGAQGWHSWLCGGVDGKPRLAQRASLQLLLVIGLLIISVTAGLTMILRAVNGAAPLLDSLTTALSLAAQYMLNRKLLENWYIWIIADVLYVYLYVVRGLHLTAMLYGVFLCLCLTGLWQWRRGLLVQTGDATSAAR